MSKRYGVLSQIRSSIFVCPLFLLVRSWLFVLIDSYAFAVCKAVFNPNPDYYCFMKMFISLVGMSVLAWASMADARSWTNKDGRALEADFVSATDEAVTVRLANGREFNLSLDSLSQADRDFVAQEVAKAKAAAPVVRAADAKFSGAPVKGHVVPKAATDVEKYALVRSLGEGAFKSHVGGVCVDAKDRVFAAGDKLVVVFDGEGKESARFNVEFDAGAVAPGANDTVWVANSSYSEPPSVVQYDMQGKKLGSLELESKKAPVTGLATFGDEVFVGTSGSGSIGRYKEGKLVNVIGRAPGARRGLSTCCGILDFCVDEQGYVSVAELGGHRVSVFDRDGNRIGTWGKEGRSAEQFTGCCNPVSIASLGKGRFVTSEKDVPRVKIYTGDEKVLEMCVDVNDIAKGCGQLDVAVDSKGNIYAAHEGKKCVIVLGPSK